MILHMPDIDTTHVDQAKATYEQAAIQYRDAELHAAAQIIRALHGTSAARLIIEQDDTATNLMVLLDLAGDVLWFNSDQAYDYPGAEKISDDRGRPLVEMDQDVIFVIEQRLINAYDANNAIGGALEMSDDEFFDPSSRLYLDIYAALGEDEPEPPAGKCERCQHYPITDTDCGLCDVCTANNDSRVVL